MSLDMVQINGWRGWHYYLLFPLDAFGTTSDARLAYQQAKLEELLPFLGWLCPLFVVGAATTSLGWGGLLLLLSLEAALLAGLSKFHLDLAPNQAVEVWLNLWLSMLGMSFVVAVGGLVFGGLAAPTFEWD